MVASKGRRIESPSSINTYKQCPRKYFYQYVKKLPTSTSIHLIRGSIVHSVLEHFFEIDLTDERIQNFRSLHMRLFSLFTKHWKKKEIELNKLGLSEEELTAYFDESVMMLQNWFDRFKRKIELRIKEGETFLESFTKLTPVCEEKYMSNKYRVMGFIDAIHKLNGKVLVIDYKTSKKDEITPAYRLQLAIYALMYEEKHGIKPDFVGIDFIKGSERILTADEDLINHAKFEIEQVPASTESDDIIDYPQNPTPLCKWRTGQCDFYDVCFGGKSLEEFREKNRRL